MVEGVFQNFHRVRQAGYGDRAGQAKLHLKHDYDKLRLRLHAEAMLKLMGDKGGAAASSLTPAASSTSRRRCTASDQKLSRNSEPAPVFERLPPEVAGDLCTRWRFGHNKMFIENNGV